MTYAVEFENVSRLYGDVRAVDGVSLAVNDGEFFSMLGPSGSGKTTCLRLIAGFEQLSGGAIRIFGREASELPPWERDVNTVFQDYALFPHMSILDNVAYGLMVKGVDKKTRHASARQALEKVALDLKLREQMQFELKKLQQDLGITFIFVTHDQGEALSMSDRVAVFNNGKIEQIDTPRELYLRPRTPFVAGFVGTSNVFDDRRAGALCAMNGVYSLRPEHIRLNQPGEIQVQGVVQAVQYQGAATRFELKLTDGEKLLVSQANMSDALLPDTLAPGQTVLASWSREAMVPLQGAG